MRPQVDLRFAAQGAVERHPSQPRGAARGRPGAAHQGGLADVEIRTSVRTGDTPAAERARMRRRPPHILVTTPESLYLLLGSQSGRAMFMTARSVIVDEIHAVARISAAPISLCRSRGSQADAAAACYALACSATQNPNSLVADFLVGADNDGKPAAEVAIVDSGHQRRRDLTLDVPGSPLEAVMSHEVWEGVLRPADRADRRAPHDADLREHAADGRARGAAPDRAARRARRHRASRQPVEGEAAGRRERGSRRRAEGAGRDRVARARHRHRPRRSRLPDRIAAPIATLLQRVGRRATDSAPTPKGRLFPTSRDDLVECVGAARERCGAVSSTASRCPKRRSTCSRSRSSPRLRLRTTGPKTTLFALVRALAVSRARARGLRRRGCTMVADGFATPRGRRGALLHRDAGERPPARRRGARTAGAHLGRRDSRSRRLPRPARSRTTPSSAR